MENRTDIVQSKSDLGAIGILGVETTALVICGAALFAVLCFCGTIFIRILVDERKDKRAERVRNTTLDRAKKKTGEKTKTDESYDDRPGCGKLIDDKNSSSEKSKVVVELKDFTGCQETGNTINDHVLESSQDQQNRRTIYTEGFDLNKIDLLPPDDRKPDTRKKGKYCVVQINEQPGEEVTRV